MTKAEIITRIIDRITDPWTESPEDYRYAEPIDLDTADDIIAQCREEDPDLEPEDRLPQETTPELMMEAFNCNVRHQKHELRVLRLAEFITDNEMVCEYDNYYAPTLDNPIDMIPVDFLINTRTAPFSFGNDTPDVLKLITIGQASVNTFDMGDEFCWFDSEKEILHSTSRPFRDGILDAEAFARFVLDDPETLSYFLDGIMDDDDIRKVFGCERKEVTC